MQRHLPNLQERFCDYRLSERKRRYHLPGNSGTSQGDLRGAAWGEIMADSIYTTYEMGRQGIPYVLCL